MQERFSLYESKSGSDGDPQSRHSKDISSDKRKSIKKLPDGIEFVCEGWLEKRSRKNKWERRFVRLSADGRLFSSKEKCVKAKIDVLDLFDPANQGVEFFDAVSAISRKSTSDFLACLVQQGFNYVFEVSASPNPIVFKAENEQIYRKWSKHLSEILGSIADLTERVDAEPAMKRKLSPSDSSERGSPVPLSRAKSRSTTLKIRSNVVSSRPNFNTLPNPKTKVRASVHRPVPPAPFSREASQSLCLSPSNIKSLPSLKPRSSLPSIRSLRKTSRDGVEIVCESWLQKLSSKNVWNKRFVRLAADGRIFFSSDKKRRRNASVTDFSGIDVEHGIAFFATVSEECTISSRFLRQTGAKYVFQISSFPRPVILKAETGELFQKWSECLPETLSSIAEWKKYALRESDAKQNLRMPGLFVEGIEGSDSESKSQPRPSSESLPSAISRESTKSRPSLKPLPDGTEIVCEDWLYKFSSENTWKKKFVRLAANGQLFFSRDKWRRIKPSVIDFSGADAEHGIAYFEKVYEASPICSRFLRRKGPKFVFQISTFPRPLILKAANDDIFRKWSKNLARTLNTVYELRKWVELESVTKTFENILDRLEEITKGLYDSKILPCLEAFDLIAECLDWIQSSKFERPLRCNAIIEGVCDVCVTCICDYYNVFRDESTVDAFGACLECLVQSQEMLRIGPDVDDSEAVERYSDPDISFVNKMSTLIEEALMQHVETLEPDLFSSTINVGAVRSRMIKVCRTMLQEFDVDRSQFNPVFSTVFPRFQFLQLSAKIRFNFARENMKTCFLLPSSTERETKLLWELYEIFREFYELAKEYGLETYDIDLCTWMSPMVDKWIISKNEAILEMIRSAVRTESWTPVTEEYKMSNSVGDLYELNSAIVDHFLTFPLKVDHQAKMAQILANATLNYSSAVMSEIRKVLHEEAKKGHLWGYDTRQGKAKRIGEMHPEMKFNLPEKLIALVNDLLGCADHLRTLVKSVAEAEIQDLSADRSKSSTPSRDFMEGCRNVFSEVDVYQVEIAERMCKDLSLLYSREILAIMTNNPEEGIERKELNQQMKNFWLSLFETFCVLEKNYPPTRVTPIYAEMLKKLVEELEKLLLPRRSEMVPSTPQVKRVSFLLSLFTDVWDNKKWLPKSYIESIDVFQRVIVLVSIHNTDTESLIGQHEMVADGDPDEEMDIESHRILCPPFISAHKITLILKWRGVHHGDDMAKVFADTCDRARKVFSKLINFNIFSLKKKKK
eukprot:892121_1